MRHVTQYKQTTYTSELFPELEAMTHLIMGTHSIIRFKDTDGIVWVVIYQQYDGDLEGVGLSLAKFLHRIVLVNGIPGTKLVGDKIYGNGLGCIAAQYIAATKKEVGGLYIEAPQCADKEYNYNVVIGNRILMEETRSPGGPCTPAEFIENIEKHGGY